VRRLEEINMNTHEKEHGEVSTHTRDSLHVPEGEGSWEQRKRRMKQSTMTSGMKCTERSIPDDRGAGAFSGLASTSSSSPPPASSGMSLGIAETLSCLCIPEPRNVAPKELACATAKESSCPE